MKLEKKNGLLSRTSYHNAFLNEIKGWSNIKTSIRYKSSQNGLIMNWLTQLSKL